MHKTKPGPPNYWYHKKIYCMDFKARHQCQCLYGCGRQKTQDENGQTTYKIALPQLNTLFDECNWMPFVDTRYSIALQIEQDRKLY